METAVLERQGAEHNLYAPKDADLQTRVVLGLESMKESVSTQAKNALETVKSAAAAVDNKLGLSEKLHAVDEKVGFSSTIEAIDNTVADSASHVYYSLKQGNPIHAAKHVITAHTIGQAEKQKHENGPLPEMAHASKEVIKENEQRHDKEADMDEKSGEPKNGDIEAQSASTLKGDEPVLPEKRGTDSLEAKSSEPKHHKARLGYHKKRRVGNAMVIEQPIQLQQSLAAAAERQQAQGTSAEQSSSS